MFNTISLNVKCDAMYFMFIFISHSVQRCLVKTSINQLLRLEKIL